jgi:type IV fimbrial biogenesis protein FimT
MSYAVFGEIKGLDTRSTNKISGFTLLEMLVVITIAGFLLTVAVPAFQTVIADQRSTANVNELVESLILARSEAIKRGRYVTVCKSSDGSTCTSASDWNDGWIVFDNVSSADVDAVDTGDEIIRVYQGLADTVNISPNGNIDEFVSFRPVGSAGTTALNFLGTLTLCDTNGNTVPRGLLISTTGRVQLSRDVDHADNALSCA